MDDPHTPDKPKQAANKPNDRLVIGLMLLALLCVAITAAIAFHDMSSPP